MKSKYLYKLSLLALLTGSLISFESGAATDDTVGTSPGDIDVHVQRSVRVTPSAKVNSTELARVGADIATQWLQDGLVRKVRNPKCWCGWCPCSAQTLAGAAVGTARSLVDTFVFDGGHAAKMVKKGDVSAIMAIGRQAVGHGIASIPDEAEREELKQVWKIASKLAQEGENLAANGLTADGVLKLAISGHGLAKEINLVDKIMNVIPEEIKDAAKASYAFFKQLIPADYAKLADLDVGKADKRLTPFYFSIDAATFVRHMVENIEAPMGMTEVGSAAVLKLYRNEADQGRDKYFDSLPVRKGDVSVGKKSVNPATVMKELAIFWNARKQGRDAVIGEALRLVMENFGDTKAKPAARKVEEESKTN